MNTSNLFTFHDLRSRYLRVEYSHLVAIIAHCGSLARSKLDDDDAPSYDDSLLSVDVKSALTKI